MKIGIISQYFYPDGPSTFPTTIAEQLMKKGHSVRVLTTYPHYTDGKVGHGYKQRFHHVEQYKKIAVKRTPLIPSHSQNPLARAANYLSFSASSTVGSSFLAKADVIYVHATPMTASIAAQYLAKTQSIPFVIHVQDLWPESVIDSEMLPGVSKTFVDSGINKWLSVLYRQASAIIGISPAMARSLQERANNPDKVSTILNWSNRFDDGAVFSQKRFSADGKTRLLYGGNLGVVQDVDTILEAMSFVGSQADVELNIAGGGVREDKLRELTKILGLANVNFLGSLNSAAMGEVYKQTDFQLVTLKDRDVFRETIPSKLQAGLAAGVPVISNIAGEVARTIHNARCGLATKPENPKSLADSILIASNTTQSERNTMSRQGRNYYEKHMSLAKGIDSIENILLEATTADRPVLS